MRSWNYTKLECTRVLCVGSTYEKLHTTRSPPIYERAIHQYENVSDLSIQWWVVARCNWHYSSVTIIKLLIRIYNQIILMLKITQFSSQLLLNNCTVCCNYQTSLVLCFDDLVWLNNCYGSLVHKAVAAFAKSYQILTMLLHPIGYYLQWPWVI